MELDFHHHPIKAAALRFKKSRWAVCKTTTIENIGRQTMATLLRLTRMLRLVRRARGVWLLTLGLGVSSWALPAQTPASAPSQATPAHHHSKKSAPAPEAPQASPAPLTLEEQQPVPPNVTYRNGQLTIDASNATLSQVLHSVQAKTGASVDIPASASGERVAAVIGPGQPRDVLVTLLNGSKFDYVILGVNGNPGGVQKIILTPRQAGGSQPASTAQSQPQPLPQDQAEEEIQPAEAEVEPAPPEHPMPPGRFRPPSSGALAAKPQPSNSSRRRKTAQIRKTVARRRSRCWKSCKKCRSSSRFINSN